MKKILILISLMAFAGCTATETEDSVSVQVKQILLSGEQVSFDFQLVRNDLGLQTPEMDSEDVIYMEDLPEGLQVTTMSLNGDFSACSTGFTPYRCDADNLSGEYDLEAMFADGHQSKLKIKLDLPEGLEAPELVQPSEKPKSGDKLAMAFKDVGADKYEVSINLCEEYGNNGINPCLEGIEYVLVRNTEGVLEIDGNAYIPVVNVADGVVSLSSDYPLNYSVNVEYRVKALSTGESAGVKNYIENEAELSL